MKVFLAACMATALIAGVVAKSSIATVQAAAMEKQERIAAIIGD